MRHRDETNEGAEENRQALDEGGTEGGHEGKLLP